MKNLLIIILLAASFSVFGQTDLVLGADLNFKNEVTSIGGRAGFIDNNSAGGYVFYKHTFYETLTEFIDIDLKGHAIGMGAFVVVADTPLLLNVGIGVQAIDTEVTTKYLGTFANVSSVDQQTNFIVEGGLSYMLDRSTIGLNITNATEGVFNLSVNILINQ
jgi:hypothetical protein